MTNLSTARGRELGARLAEYRTNNMWEVEELAARLGWSAHKLVAAERGERMLSELDTAVLLTACGAGRVEREEALELLDGHGPAGCWARPDRFGLPEGIPSVLLQYQRATGITCYDPDGIPALLHGSGFHEAELCGRFGEGALALPHVLNHAEHRGVFIGLPQPPVCYLSERALRAIGGDEEARLDQFRLMAGMLREGSAVIRVIPVAAESAVPRTGFALLRFAEAGPVVCVPTQTATLILEGDPHVPVYEGLVAELAAVALSCQASTDLIVGLAGGLDAVHRLLPDDVMALVYEAMS